MHHHRVHSHWLRSHSRITCCGHCSRYWNSLGFRLRLDHSWCISNFSLWRISRVGYRFGLISRNLWFFFLGDILLCFNVVWLFILSLWLRVLLWSWCLSLFLFLPSRCCYLLVRLLVLLSLLLSSLFYFRFFLLYFLRLLLFILFILLSDPVHLSLIILITVCIFLNIFIWSFFFLIPVEWLLDPCV